MESFARTRLARDARLRHVVHSRWRHPSPLRGRVCVRSAEPKADKPVRGLIVPEAKCVLRSADHHPATRKPDRDMTAASLTLDSTMPPIRQLIRPWCFPSSPFARFRPGRKSGSTSARSPFSPTCRLESATKRWMGDRPRRTATPAASRAFRERLLLRDCGRSRPICGAEEVKSPRPALCRLPGRHTDDQQQKCHKKSISHRSLRAE